MSFFVPLLNFEQLYAQFDQPVTDVDCGGMCAPHNPSGKPFCCDICRAVPAAYHQEWAFLQRSTSLWQRWKGDECADENQKSKDAEVDTPEHMLLLACKGPDHCQRDFRAISCRQFPFSPYITSRDRFIGLVYEWEFESTCWLISNLGRVSTGYRREFIEIYDDLFALWEEEFDSYAIASDEMRQHFIQKKRRFPLLHRNGGFYLVSPASERMQRVLPEGLRQYGPYREKPC